MNKKKVLFVCIHNSARSQMAEELLRKLASDKFDVESAGIEPGKVNPLAIEVLMHRGIDIKGKITQSVEDVIRKKIDYDYVITVCDETSAERCPIIPGAKKRLHWSFDDPSSFQGQWDDQVVKTMEICCKIENKIKEWLIKRP